MSMNVLTPTLETVVRNSKGKFEQALRQALHTHIDSLPAEVLRRLAFPELTGQVVVEPTEELNARILAMGAEQQPSNDDTAEVLSDPRAEPYEMDA